MVTGSTWMVPLLGDAEGDEPVDVLVGGLARHVGEHDVACRLQGGAAQHREVADGGVAGEHGHTLSVRWVGRA